MAGEASGMTIRLTNRLFGTHPIVAHSPGPRGPDWARFENAVLSAPARKCRCGELTILTWNNGPRPEKPTGVFERSVARLGLKVEALGAGISPWKNIFKLRLTAEALAKIQTPYVMAADSSDAALCDDPAILVERFRQHYTCDLLLNATGSRCWPELPEFVRFESSLPMAAVAQGRHWLNSGVWIGKTEFCREFFARLAAEPPVAGFEHSDQAIFKQAWPRWYPRVQLDYLSHLFQWYNEPQSVLLIERPLALRQRQLIDLLLPLGPKLRGAEIGVFDGYTSDALLRGLPGLELWLVDAWKPYEGESQLGSQDAAYFERAKSAALWWTNHAAERRYVLQQESSRAAPRFGDASLDFVFIDANHLYENVRSDIRAWWPKVRPGGLVIGHDYGVDRDADGRWGVRRAVDEFAAMQCREVRVEDDGVWWLRR
jgi:predicted O-methyltransferase YrrM